MKGPDVRMLIMLCCLWCGRYHRHGKGETAQQGDAVTGNPRPPPYLAKHAKVTSVTLAQEAHETMLAVHKMLQIKSESCVCECVCVCV